MVSALFYNSLWFISFSIAAKKEKKNPERLNYASRCQVIAKLLFHPFLFIYCILNLNFLLCIIFFSLD